MEAALFRDDDQTGFYVSVINGRRRGLLLGPYDDHETALQNVERGRTMATDRDAFADFYWFGTCKITTTKALPNGVLGK